MERVLNSVKALRTRPSAPIWPSTPSMPSMPSWVLVVLAGAALEDLPGESVAAFLEVGMGLDLALVGRFVGQAQDGGLLAIQP